MKNKEKKKEDALENRQCPLCEEALSAGKHFYCPACGMEIDYLLSIKVKNLSEAEKEEIKQGSQKIKYTYIVASVAYLATWLMVYFFVIQNRLN